MPDAFDTLLSRLTLTLQCDSDRYTVYICSGLDIAEKGCAARGPVQSYASQLVYGVAVTSNVMADNNTITAQIPEKAVESRGLHDTRAGRALRSKWHGKTQRTCVTMPSTGCSGAVFAPGSPWMPRPSSIVPGATL